MQWNCPQCGVYLTLPQESLGTGWAFSRCYQCAGFALIRRTEVNVIKVDRAPPGERVLLPEALRPGKFAAAAASSSSSPQSNAHATSIPLLREFNSHLMPETTTTTPLSSPAHLRSLGGSLGVSFSEHGATADESHLHSPPKLLTAGSPVGQPETRGGSSARRYLTSWMSLAIYASGFVCVGSGAYLAIQVQNYITHLMPTQRHPAAAVISSNPNNSAAHKPGPSQALAPSSLAVAPTLAPPLLDPKQGQQVAMITDKMQQSAMAPIPADSNHPPTLLPPTPPASAPKVWIRLQGAQLHLGPGTQSAVVGQAATGQAYQVLQATESGWSFLQEDPQNPSLSANALPLQKGWVKNEWLTHSHP